MSADSADMLGELHQEIIPEEKVYLHEIDVFTFACLYTRGFDLFHS